MKFSYHFLSSWVQYPENFSAEKLCVMLTNQGFEVEACEHVSFDYEHVVVGKVLEIKQHPNADRLNVCQVQVSSDSSLEPAEQVRQIVCGAKDLQLGMHYPIALPGAKLPGGKIKKGKLRGEVSNGMICSASELNLGFDSNQVLRLGYDSPIGATLAQLMGQEDWLIEIDITPDRGDAISYLGIAREVAAGLNTSYAMPSLSELLPLTPSSHASHTQLASNDSSTEGKAPSLQVHLDDARCPSYHYQQLSGFQGKQQLSPYRVLETLRRSGVRCHDLLVDVTNWVLTEMGQPLHAFDATKLQGDIHVRPAKANETLTLLDETKAVFNQAEMLIADEQKALALAGVMGGIDSGVGEDCDSILLECAYFLPDAIQGKARELGIVSQAAYHYERGVDWNLQAAALERASQAICGLTQAIASQAVIVHGPKQPQAIICELSTQMLRSRLGVELSTEQLAELLTRLDIQVIESKDHSLRLQAPSWRFDLAIAEDYVEEVARLVGLDQLPDRPVPQGPGQVNTLWQRKIALRQKLSALGLHETIHYSMVDPSIQAKLLNIDPENQLTLTNPLSQEQSVLRQSMLPGLFAAMQHNANHQLRNFAGYELGHCYHEQGQTATLGLLISGNLYPQDSQHLKKGRPRSADLYDLKGLLLQLFIEVPLSFEQVTDDQGQPPYYQEDALLAVKVNGQIVGWVGKVHSQAAKLFQSKLSVIYAELNYDLILQLESKQTRQYVPFNRFPSIARDLSFKLPATANAQRLIDLALSQAQMADTKLDVHIFDYFEDKDKQRYYGLRLSWTPQQDSLTDATINEVTAKLLAFLASHDIHLRSS